MAAKKASSTLGRLHTYRQAGGQAGTMHQCSIGTVSACDGGIFDTII